MVAFKMRQGSGATSASGLIRISLCFFPTESSARWWLSRLLRSRTDLGTGPVASPGSASLSPRLKNGTREIIGEMALHGFGCIGGTTRLSGGEAVLSSRWFCQFSHLLFVLKPH